MKYKAIISDIDGTLTVSARGALPTEQVKTAIRAVQDKNLLFSVASARPYNLMSYLINDIPLLSPVIINNGAEIYDPKLQKPIWESTIPDTIAKKIFLVAKKFPKYHVDYARTEVANPEELKTTEQIYKFLIFHISRTESERFIKELQNIFPMLHFTKAPSYIGKDLYDIYITNGDATKQHAVLKFAELMQIDTKEIIGIGDNYNDFPLLMACGLKVAMGNAVDELKQIADYIAPTVQKDGVADVIKKFIL